MNDSPLLDMAAAFSRQLVVDYQGFSSGRKTPIRLWFNGHSHPMTFTAEPTDLRLPHDTARPRPNAYGPTPDPLPV